MRSWVDNHRLLLLSIGLAIAYHGGMVFYTFSRTYDAYVHIPTRIPA